MLNVQDIIAPDTTVETQQTPHETPAALPATFGQTAGELPRREAD